MKLGIDLDDVAVEFRTGFRKLYWDHFGIYYPDTGYWDLKTISHFKDDESLWTWIEKSTPNFFHELEPVKGAVESLQKLAQDHEITIITDKPKWAEDAPLYWLTKWRVPYSSIYITKTKADISCDIYLDDGPHNLVALRTCTNAIVARMVKPWNFPMADVVDINSWDEFVALVNAVG